MESVYQTETDVKINVFAGAFFQDVLSYFIIEFQYLQITCHCLALGLICFSLVFCKVQSTILAKSILTHIYVHFMPALFSDM